MTDLAQEVKIYTSGLVELTTIDKDKNTNITCQLSDYVNYMSSMFSSIRTPLLPQYCRFYAKKKDKVCVVLERPAHTVKVLKTQYGNVENVTIPTTIWFFDLNERPDGTLTTSYNYLFCIGSLEALTLDTDMSHFIFPHYSAGYHGICWGSSQHLINTLSAQLANLGRLPDLFFATSSSDHLPPPDKVVNNFISLVRNNNVPHIDGFPSGFAYVYDVLKNAPQLTDSLLIKSGQTPRALIAEILGDKNVQRF